MTTVTRLQPKDLSSDLDEIAREGARRMLAEALEAEVADYITGSWKASDGLRIVSAWQRALNGLQSRR